MTEIKLGDIAKDKVTGFKGTVVAITEWLHGCMRMTIQPEVNKLGIVPDSMSFDEPSLEVVGKKKIKRKTDTGGFQDEPTRNYKI